MKQDTKLVRYGRGAAEFEEMVNIPAHCASTTRVVFSKPWFTHLRNARHSDNSRWRRRKT